MTGCTAFGSPYSSSLVSKKSTPFGLIHGFPFDQWADRTVPSLVDIIHNGTCGSSICWECLTFARTMFLSRYVCPRTLVIKPDTISLYTRRPEIFKLLLCIKILVSSTRHDRRLARLDWRKTFRSTVFLRNNERVDTNGPYFPHISCYVAL